MNMARDILLMNLVHLTLVVQVPVDILIQTGCLYLTGSVISTPTCMQMKAGDQDLMGSLIFHGMLCTKTAHTLVRLMYGNLTRTTLRIFMIQVQPLRIS